MGFKLLELKMPTDFTPGELKKKISKKLRIKPTDFSYSIEKQSLDARQKHRIHWKIRVGVSSPALPGPEHPTRKIFTIPSIKQKKKVVVVGSGPAGFFAGYTLLTAGFAVVLLEQGPDVNTRFKDIVSYERTGILNERSNYAFGEGGAGTFSDGKLTSRTKSISNERGFVFDTYVEAGAPPEITYLAHPHLGSDNLRKIVKNLRKMFLEKNGSIFFDTRVINIQVNKSSGVIQKVETEKGKMEADYFIFAVGHSSYDTYRMLIRSGVPFQVKPFAVGCRVEHPQEIINRAQWGQASLPGIKAAEYRLTFKEEGLLPVYSFCMCPGGKVVPAAAYKHTNIVNGMSNYRRNGPFANTAIVVGIHLNRLFNREFDPLEALEWLGTLEQKFFNFSDSYSAPACKINDFLEGRISSSFMQSTYPLGLVPSDFSSLFPGSIITALKAGMKHFCQKIKDFEKGVMLGLESKTSSPIQTIREKNRTSAGIRNLYIAGEGSGHAGGIVSSAADGIKAALEIISQNN
ncbi:MAG: FAD-dependent oxidoreductase [Candidatus Aminicenantes bacterium]|nr:FAD-dependent oxidoreductase [Candidatus Aminicenantes bacterium]NIM84297.1 FAD-dependent oxidoreductase [Candidatus Aminicenantes bacterium]NIN23783.1 FAD-dependent oxidoreductase [Candidatus Aminicenantes bacterium]NIN47499.1 FAD-dependent oxidoreductase [Candidatus Aminicenantes bacterium]NIN90419.1 FAD-dependent oxidoreductase [Candidatus Aminicenantes bacterium]